MQENIAAARLVKAFVRADFEGARFKAANKDLTDRSVRVMRFMSSMSPALTVFVNIGMVTVTWASGLASARRVNQVLDTVPEIQDLPQAIALPDQAPARVVFENVAFRYDGDGSAADCLDDAVLQGINLAAEPGETVAILGATGAGKSTLVNLVPRFYDVCAGRVLMDGIDIRHLRQDSLLAQIAVVPQETILFSGTVRDNIRYGRPDATDDQVVAAAQAAQAHDFVMALSKGYDTHVQERGVNLSGGQKQRVAIARALLTQPKILILDDSTSSVDVETETKIQAALDQQARRHTSLVVAQRISTVLKADKIIVIDQGRIVAEGTHQALMQFSPIYREIYDSQLGDGLRQAKAGE